MLLRLKTILTDAGPFQGLAKNGPVAQLVRAVDS